MGEREREREREGRGIVQGRWRVKYLLISELYGSFLNVLIHNFDSLNSFFTTFERL